MSAHCRSRAFAVLGLVFSLASCGPTNQDVIDAHKERYAAKRKQFAEIAGKLPPVGSVLEDGCQAKLDPKPLYDVKAQSYNTEIVMEKQLLDPDVFLERGTDFDINLSDALLRGILWTGPKNPMSEGAQGNRADDSFKADLDNALAYRYLVVNRPVSYTPPKALDEKTFTPGTADVEGFLFDLQSGQLLCSFRYRAKTADSVSYEYKREERDGQTVNVDNPLERLEAFAYSSLWTSARQDAARILTSITEGVFVLERY